MPLHAKITKIPLPVNGHRNSTDGDGKLRTESSSHAESNGGGGDENWVWGITTIA